MEPEALIARLALAKGWISREEYVEILERAPRSPSGSVEDSLRAAGLSGEQIRTLRGALHSEKEVCIGDWRLHRRVGIGGMGSVFEARHRRTGRRAAIKVLLPRLGREPEFTARFVHEAQALGRISHPNVVHAFDAGRSGDLYFIAMEFVDGEDLQRLLERERCLSPVRSAEIALDVARALEAIEAAGLIHRDVKPSNILIDASGAVKLADLGLFHDDVDPRVLWDGMVFGTPQYMSPEQVLGKKTIDIRSDLYSLGATWYHALIGRPPFDGDVPALVARMQVDRTPIPPRQIRPDVPVAMEGLILELLRKDPKGRPSGPRAVVEAIERFLADLRKGPRAAEHRRRSIPRSWMVVGGGVLIALGLLVWGGASLLEPSSREAGGSPSPAPAVAPPPAGGGGQAPSPERLAEAARVAAGSLRRGFSRALPTLPARIRAALSPKERAGGAAKDLRKEAPSQPTARGGKDEASAIDPEVRAWASRGAADAKAKFARFLLGLPEGRSIEVLLRDGIPVEAEGTPGLHPALRAVGGGPIPIEALHPVSVIAWAALDPKDPLPEAGLALALEEGDVRSARMILEALSPEVPRNVREAVATAADVGPAVDAPREYLARSLRDFDGERRAMEHVLAGRWNEAAAAFEVLLAARPPSPAARERAPERERFRERSRTFALILSAKSFAGRAAAADPLQGALLEVRYDFEDAAELADLRFDPAAWAHAESSLERKDPGKRGAPRRTKGDGLPDLGRIQGSAVDTVAIYRPPVSVEGTWRSGPKGEDRIIIGFGGRFIALGPRWVIGSWRDILERGRLPDPPPRAAPPRAGGEAIAFRLDFLDDGAAATFPGSDPVEVTFGPAEEPLEPPGRVTIGLDPGSALLDLKIRGALDPAWVEGRIEALGR
jgi:hypothetical protein